VQKEEESLRSFIALNTLRFGDSFISYRSEIVNPARLIAPMLLIPLVENAIKHGDKKADTPGIRISLKVDQHIAFEVVNLLPEEHIQKDHAGGVGIANLKRWLALLYPDSHTFENTIANNTYTARLWIR